LPASIWAAMPMFLILDSLRSSRFIGKIWTISAEKSTSARRAAGKDPNSPRPLAPYSSPYLALPDSPVIGSPSAQIRNSQPYMGISFVYWCMEHLYWNNLYLVTGPAPAQTRRICALLIIVLFFYGSAPLPPTQSGTRVLPRWSGKKRSYRPGVKKVQ